MILEEYDPEFHMRKEKELSFEQGITQGRMEGTIDTLLALVRKDVRPESAAAEQAGMPLEEFRQLLNR